jgi:uncharacterized protein
MGGGPVPLSQVVLKVHSRCDLSCDHCYVYEAADQSWRSRPKVVSDEVVAQAGRRIAEHAVTHGLPEVQVVLHGGEPLLAGYDRLRGIITALHRALDGTCRLDLRIHTNGVRLSAQLCELFAEHRVKVGISIDGDRAANDRHRRYADGRSSYDQVIRAIELLNTGRFRGLFAGLLCTIDVANDPLVVYESLMALRPPRIDFLLPHATWDHPPRRTPGADHEYADWLTAIHNRWADDGRPVEIRTFDSIVATLRGGESRTEALGLGPTGLVVIESDGSYEQVDSLKVAFEGAPATGMNVFSHSLDMVARHPGIAAREQGLAGLCRTCQECPVVSSCGGGLYTHRYRDGRGFDNPSVYCADLLALITHISKRLPEPDAATAALPPHTVSTASFDALAAGRGDAAAIGSLIEAQRSLMRALLTTVYQEAVNAPAVAEPVRGELRAAWAVLTVVDRDRPGALRAMLGHPPLRAWAVHCLEQLRGPLAGAGHHDLAAVVRLAADLGHLGAIAAAAAAHGRASAAVTVPVLDGAVHLPTLGRLVLGRDQVLGRADGDPRTAAVSVISNAVVIQAGESCWTLGLADLLAGQLGAAPAAGNNRSADWQPVRTLRAAGWCPALEDTDPYRDCYPWPAAARLAEAEAARWQRQAGLAWAEIEREYPQYAPGLAAALTTLTPLAGVQDRLEVSAAARQAFGAVAVSPPANPASLARLLVQEGQRAKLGAVLDLFDLYDQADDRLYPAPWGEEKLPLDGLLQGAYVRLAAPGCQSAEWRAHTAEAISILLDSGALRPLGMRFVRLMRHSLDDAGAPAKDH